MAVSISWGVLVAGCSEWGLVHTRALDSWKLPYE